MPGSVSSDKVGYCKLVFTSLGNIYLKYRWVLYHLEKQAGCYKGSRGQGVVRAYRWWKSCTFLVECHFSEERTGCQKKEVVKRGGFLYTPLHTNTCPSPGRVAKNKGTRYLGGVTRGLSLDTSGTDRKNSVSLEGAGGWKHTVNTLSRRAHSVETIT